MCNGFMGQHALCGIRQVFFPPFFSYLVSANMNLSFTHACTSKLTRNWTPAVHLHTCAKSPFESRAIVQWLLHLNLHHTLTTNTTTFLQQFEHLYKSHHTIVTLPRLTLSSPLPPQPQWTTTTNNQNHDATTNMNHHTIHSMPQIPQPQSPLTTTTPFWTNRKQCMHVP